MQNKKEFFGILLSVLICVFLVGFGVWATTTISDSITVGDDLTVTDVASVSGNFYADEFMVDSTTGYVGIATTSPDFIFTIGDNGGILAKGTFGSGDVLPTDGSGTRFIWYPRKGAIRAGTVGGVEWNDANIGDYSVVFGQNSSASATGSVVLGGSRNTASNIYTVVGGGDNNESSGQRSAICGGQGNEATANHSAVLGGQTNIAKGLWSNVVGGMSNQASGMWAMVPGGRQNVAAGDYSFAAGRYMQIDAEADNSFALGYSASALGIGQSNAFIIYGLDVGINTVSPSFDLAVESTASISETLNLGAGQNTISSGTASISSNCTIGDIYFRSGTSGIDNIISICDETNTWSPADL